MSPDDFWALVDSTRPPEPDTDAHARALTQRLVALGADEARDFAGQFDAAIDHLYRWDLWGACYLAFGGCSDDAFEYFRAWIVGQGRAMWGRAAEDCERLFVELLDGADDPEHRWAELGVHEGEPLLYAAGSAHEELTGEWRARVDNPPSEPSGEEWDEEDLADRFPRLVRALPADMWDIEVGDDQAGVGHVGDDPVLDTVVDGLSAAAGGDHETATEMLSPLIDESWSHLVTLGLATDVAYTVGIGRLLAGDLERARTALERVPDPPDHVRRALAQIALAEGDLEGADRLLEDGSDAHLFDQALGSVLAQRNGESERARALVSSVLESAGSELHVPWDAAGAALQGGLVSVELADHAQASRAVLLIGELIADAPTSLPLIGQLEMLRAGSLRLERRHSEALAVIEQALPRLEGPDIGHVWRESARCLHALGDVDGAIESIARAVAAFEACGEVWQASDTRRESADWH